MNKLLAIAATIIATAPAYSQTEVLRIELADGSIQTVAVSTIKEMTFDIEDEPEPDPEPSLTGTYTGDNSVVVGGTFTYVAENIACGITDNGDGTLDFTWPEYSLTGTVMGDLTLGSYTISGISWDEDKQAYYRDFSNDGLEQHFTAVKDGVTNMDKMYTLGQTSTIEIKFDDGNVTVVCPFKLGAMPLPITATFNGTLSDK